MNPEYKITRETRQLFQKIEQIAAETNMSLYPVGGFVRDLLLGTEIKDIDFVVIGDAKKFLNAFKKRFPVDAVVFYPKFSTCMCSFLGYQLEFVTARSESYMQDSRKPVVRAADLFTDLSRRDFTINTMAMELKNGQIVRIHDPYDGCSDLQKGIIRTPLEPATTFSDDPLRMMRAIRFAAHLNFRIGDNTFNAIGETAARLSIVSQERITQEFNKILMSGQPSRGIILLDEAKLLPLFLPEFVKTKGVEQRQEYHHKDVFFHTLKVLDKISTMTDKLELRLAALFHDIAKPRTKRFSEKAGWTFHGHEVVGERMSNAILKRLKYPGDTIAYVRKLVRLHLRPMALIDDGVTDSAIRRLLFHAGEDFDDLMLLCRADITSKNRARARKYLNNYENVLKKAAVVEDKDRMRAFKCPVDGTEIMEKLNLEPGPLIGKLKNFVEESILEGIIPNEHDAAWNYLIEHKEELLRN